MSARTHFVYRAYDESGELLYVGLTGNLESRMSWHRAASPWGHRTHHLRLDGPLTRESAVELERWRIRRNRPTFNKVRTPPTWAYSQWRDAIENRRTTPHAPERTHPH